MSRRRASDLDQYHVSIAVHDVEGSCQGLQGKEQCKGVLVKILNSTHCGC
jgi:hypothetical protein